VELPTKISLTAAIVSVTAGKPLLAAGTSVADVVDRWHAETERAIKRSHVVVDLRDGETLRFMVDLHYDELRAGTYSARLHYAVKRNIQGLNVDGSFRHPDQATLTRAKTLWEGTVVSDWITFNVVDAPRSGP